MLWWREEESWFWCVKCWCWFIGLATCKIYEYSSYRYNRLSPFPMWGSWELSRHLACAYPTSRSDWGAMMSRKALVIEGKKQKKKGKMLEFACDFYRAIWKSSSTFNSPFSLELDSVKLGVPSVHVGVDPPMLAGGVHASAPREPKLLLLFDDVVDWLPRWVSNRMSDILERWQQSARNMLLNWILSSSSCFRNDGHIVVVDMEVFSGWLQSAHTSEIHVYCVA